MKNKGKMLGSHNSFSYLPIRAWYLWILRPWVRCQDLDIGEQYAQGVRYFDLRLRFGKKGEPQVVHNFTRLRISPQELERWLAWLDAKGGVVMRVVLDVRKPPKDGDALKSYFSTYYDYLFSQYPHIDFHSTVAYEAWSLLEVHDEYGSFKHKLCIPWLWSVLHNAKVKRKYKDLLSTEETRRVLFMDFVEKG